MASLILITDRCWVVRWYINTFWACHPEHPILVVAVILDSLSLNCKII